MLLWSDRFLAASLFASGTRPSLRRAARPAIVPLLLALTCLSADAQEQTAAQIKCITRMNKDGAGVASAQGRVSSSCVDAVLFSGESDLDACMASDLRFVPRSRARTDKDDTKLCSTVRPDFGVPPSGDISDTVNDSALAQKSALLREMLGSDPTAVLVASRDLPGVPDCQSAVLGSCERLIQASLKLFGTCKRTALKGGAAPAIATAAELGECLEGRADSLDSDSRGKIRSALDGLRDTYDLHCADFDSANVFPGPCASAPELPDCLGERVRCRVCAMANAMDGLAVDCDRFDDGQADFSCIENCDGDPCDDTDLCTDDVCDLAAGCSYGNNTAPCSDGEPCTVNDHCSSGACTPGVRACPEIWLSPDPLSVHPDTTRELTVAISEPAPAGGVAIALVSADPGVATVPSSVLIPEGGSSAVATVSGGTFGATTVTASLTGYFGATAAIQVELGSILLRLIDTPLVGVGRDATLEVELVQPQSGGPVTVGLLADDPGLVAVPTSVDFAAGQARVRTTIRGLAEGTTVLRATAPGFESGELDILGQLPIGITTRLVILSLDDTLTPREDLPIPVRLSVPAPAGVTVTLDSVDPTVMTVNTPTVAFGAGETASSSSLHGVSAGTTRLRGHAPNYATDIADIEVSAELRATPAPFHALSGVANVMTITYYHDGSPHVAPAGGIDVGLVVGDPGCITIDSPSKSILAGQVSTTVTVTGIPPAQCSTTITATSAETGITVFPVLPAGPLAFGGFRDGNRIGAGLQTASYFGVPYEGVVLGAPAPTGGVMVHVQTQDSSQVLVAVDAAVAASPSIDLFVPEGATHTSGFYAASAAGAPLNVGTTLVATAPGYQGTTSETLQVVAPSYYTYALSSGAYLGVVDEFSVCTAVHSGGTLFASQVVAGGAALTLTVGSSAALVGEMQTSVASGGSVQVDIPAGQSCTPFGVSSGGVAFEGLSVGTTSVSSSGGGLSPCESLTGGAGCTIYYGPYYATSATGVVDVTVDVPPLLFYGFRDGSRIGAGLQTASYSGFWYSGVVLGAPAPSGGVTVHLESQDPSLVLLAASPTMAGSSSIDLFVAEGGTNTAEFHASAAPGAPLNAGTTLVFTAPGYQSLTSEVLQIVAPVYYTYHLPSEVNVGATDEFQVCTAVHNHASSFFSQAAAGGAPLTLAVESSMPLAGEVRTSGASGGIVQVDIPPGERCTPFYVSTGGIAFRALSTGSTSVSSSGGGLVACESVLAGGNCTVLGYDNGITTTGVVDVTVETPPLSFYGFRDGSRIGAGLQTASYSGTSYSGVVLGAPAPPGGVTVHLASQDPSQVLLAASPTAAGSASIDLFVAEGATNTAGFYANAAPGAPLNVGTRLDFTAPGYQSLTSDILEVVTPTYYTTGLPDTVSVGVTREFQVCTAVHGQSNFFASQAVAGGSPLALTVQSSAALVGEVRTSGSSGASVQVDIPAGGRCSPYGVASGGVAFRGLSTSLTSVSSSGGEGLVACESLLADGGCSIYGYFNGITTTGVIDVAVDLPPLSFGGFSSGVRVGAGLQVSFDYGVTLGAPAPPGGVTVHLVSQDPSQVLLAATSTVAGSASLDMFVPEGATSTSPFYVHSAPGAPLNVGTTLQATAPGYQSATSEVLQVVTPAYFTLYLGASLSVGAIDEFQVCTAVPEGGIYFSARPVAGGGPLTLTVHSSVPSAGEVQTSSAAGGSVQVQIPSGQICTPYALADGGVALHGVAAGTVNVSASGAGLVACESLLAGGNCYVSPWPYGSTTGVVVTQVQ